MTTDPASSDATRRSRPTGAGVAADLMLGFLLASAWVAATWWLLGLEARYAVAGVVMAGALVTTVGWAFRRRGSTGEAGASRGPGIGAANRVTLARATLAVPVGTLAVTWVPLTPGAAWLTIGLSTVVMLLDGLDGRVARRTGSQSAFGARFDMELDAALLLALSVLVWATGKVGPWVLLIGLLRYAFVAAGALWPALAGDLPESFRRKLVCVIQGIVLLVALGPIIPSMLATFVAALGLGLLLYSFGSDTAWLLSRDRVRAPPGGGP